jgi:hypothetical protein
MEGENGRRPKMSATSRDPEDFANATRVARKMREEVAREVAQCIAEQVEELIVAGDIMGGRALVAKRVQQVLDAERRGDREVLRAACMEGAVAFGAWVAALDYVPPVSEVA